jgi:hypothetical protein
MGRPVKWSRDLHPIRERLSRIRQELLSRQEIEALFQVGRVSAQSLMRAIGEVQSIGAAHFVERTAVLAFLDEMLAAQSVADGLRAKVRAAEPPPRPRPVRVHLPPELRAVLVRDLPEAIQLAPGRLSITADTAEGMLERLALLAQALGNDLDTFRRVVEPPLLPEDADADAPG